MNAYEKMLAEAVAMATKPRELPACPGHFASTGRGWAREQINGCLYGVDITIVDSITTDRKSHQRTAWRKNGKAIKASVALAELSV